jgi:hypothetical protein
LYPAGENAEFQPVERDDGPSGLGDERHTQIDVALDRLHTVARHLTDVSEG